MDIRKQIVLSLVILLVALAPAAYAQDEEQAAGQTPDEMCEAATPAEEPETREFDGMERVIEFGVDYYAIMCTEVGAVYIDLYETFTPGTVNNLIFLAENGFFNNTTFHRVLADFMAQGGDPTGTGTGGPGYQFNDEFVSFLTFDRVGLLAMANSGANTNGSQFFLTTELTEHLNYRHTIFGEVVDGQDVVESIPLRDPASATEPGAALETVIIVTDPTSVDADIANADIPPVDEEDFQAVLDAFPELPESLVVDEDATGILDTNAVAARAGDSEDDVATLLADNNHQFSVSAVLENAACDLENAGFASAGIMVHVFEDDADALAVVNGDSLQLLATLGGEGFEAVENDSTMGPVFAMPADACETEGQFGYFVRRLGRFVMVSQILLPESDVSIDLWLDQVVNNRVFDIVFGNLLERELRRR